MSGITLKTADDHLIYMSYRGMRHGPAWVIEQLNKGEKVDPSQYYFRTTPWFETASEKYRFLNRIVCSRHRPARSDRPGLRRVPGAVAPLVRTCYCHPERSEGSHAGCKRR